MTEDDPLQQPGPCADCWSAERCRRELLACSRFALFAGGSPEHRWRYAPRMDADRGRYDQLFDEA